MTETHTILPGSRRPHTEGARRIRDIDPQAHLEVTVTVRGPALPGPEAVAGAPLSPEDYAAQYGAKPEDVEKVEQVLRRFGLSVEHVSGDRRSLRVAGSAA